MALLHRATLHPTKLELVAGWVPQQPWASGAEPTEVVAAYRFDDPDGQVGLETLLVRTADGGLVQLPLTYRAAELAGAGEALIGTMEHSALGTRWVYDAPRDPVHIAALTAVMRDGGSGAELVDESGERIVRDTQAEVHGTGALRSRPVAPDRYEPDQRTNQSVSTTADGEFLVTYRRPLVASPSDGVRAALRGVWQGQAETVTLAVLR
ncbi:CG0192-related protein [Ruania alba]|uniref:Maltokinase N-terminal cap domain-containing protein n=1 Tax=Ruania alba TaxID=648782 RepID=A0A1H5FVQ5_9MICO|nr:hypothetical protein [Ruania alba]SEE07321.1 hypothetical protein SAMN04488554_1457 [Ruania alba]